MPSKTEEYLALAQRTANGLTRYWESWTSITTRARRRASACLAVDTTRKPPPSNCNKMESYFVL